MRGSRSFLCLFAIAFIIMGLSPVVSAYFETPAECKQKYDDEYARLVGDADSLHSVNGYRDDTCSDLEASRAGIASPCYSLTTSAEFQACCYEKAKNNAKIWRDEGYARCPKDMCDGKTLTCPDPICDGEKVSSGGKCNPDTGDCMYASVTPCQYGCDYVTFTCKPAPAQKCKPCENQYDPQLPAPDCTCIPAPCPEKCGVGMTQKPYPNCGCVAKDLCANPDGTKKKCEDKCETGLATAAGDGQFDRAIGKGECNPETGQCEYKRNDTCTVGCAMDGTVSYCKEDCDNGKIDDTRKEYKDCDHPDCSESLYCMCKPLGSHTGSPGEKVMKVLIGGYYFPPTNRTYNYKNRDSTTLDHAQKVMNAFSATDPISKLNYEFYTTRYAPDGWMFSGSDLIEKCKKVAGGGDFTMFVNFNREGSSYSYRYSMGATIYRVGLDNPANWFANEAVHEFGHGFGGLWDEYVTSTVDVLKGYPAYMVEESSLNCAMVSTRAECETYFTKFGVPFECVQECTSSTWWRPKEKNVMRYDFESGEYDGVSKVLLNKRISMYFHPEEYRITLKEFETNMKAKGFNTRQLAYVR